MKLRLKDWSYSQSLPLVSILTNTDVDKEPHYHDFFEIFYITEGSITHVLNESKETLHSGDILLIRPSDTHCFIRNRDTPCSHRDIIIDKDYLKKCCDFIDPSFFNEIISTIHPPRNILTDIETITLENYFSELEFISNNSDTTKQLATINILTIHLLSFFQKINPFTAQKLPAWIKEILPKFSSPFHMREGLSHILKDLKYDKSYLCRNFKKYMGCTMGKYLQERRLDRARLLLITTEKTLAQICSEIGFNSIPRFIITFKRKFTLPPYQYKKIFKQKSIK